MELTGVCEHGAYTLRTDLSLDGLYSIGFSIQAGLFGIQARPNTCTVLIKKSLKKKSLKKKQTHKTESI